MKTPILFPQRFFTDEVRLTVKRHALKWGYWCRTWYTVYRIEILYYSFKIASKWPTTSFSISMKSMRGWAYQSRNQSPFRQRVGSTDRRRCWKWAPIWNRQTRKQHHLDGGPKRCDNNHKNEKAIGERLQHFSQHDDIGTIVPRHAHKAQQFHRVQNHCKGERLRKCCFVPKKLNNIHLDMANYRNGDTSAASQREHKRC